jgi:hypothetical protein
VGVQREGVVAPGDVAEALRHAAVVLGVDDPLLAVVRPRVRAGRAEGGALALGQGEEPPPVLALAGERVLDVLAAARGDLDLRGDQLARDRGGQQRVGLGGLAQLVEAPYHVQRLGVEDRELLLEPDGQVL